MPLSAHWPLNTSNCPLSIRQYIPVASWPVAVYREPASPVLQLPATAGRRQSSSPLQWPPSVAGCWLGTEDCRGETHTLHCTAHCTLHTAHWTLHCTLHWTPHCTALHTAHWTLNTANCFVMHTAHYSLLIILLFANVIHNLQHTALQYLTLWTTYLTL